MKNTIDNFYSKNTLLEQDIKRQQKENRIRFIILKYLRKKLEKEGINER